MICLANIIVNLLVLGISLCLVVGGIFFLWVIISEIHREYKLRKRNEIKWQ